MILMIQNFIKKIYYHFEFPEFDPESGNPLVDIDFSEGYPVPIYGALPKDMRFKSLNAMRR